ncbi:hypothetical protein AO369_1858 [Moraxella catarrhalis]|nr:hypothetical protein AO369_1858 [Moraxella catarrhalis]
MSPLKFWSNDGQYFGLTHENIATHLNVKSFIIKMSRFLSCILKIIIYNNY